MSEKPKKPTVKYRVVRQGLKDGIHRRRKKRYGI